MANDLTTDPDRDSTPSPTSVNSAKIMSLDVSSEREVERLLEQQKGIETASNSGGDDEASNLDLASLATTKTSHLSASASALSSDHQPEEHQKEQSQSQKQQQQPSRSSHRNQQDVPARTTSNTSRSSRGSRSEHPLGSPRGARGNRQRRGRPVMHDRNGALNLSARWLSDTSHSFKRNLPGRASSAKAPTMPGRRTYDSDNESETKEDESLRHGEPSTGRSKSSGNLGLQFEGGRGSGMKSDPPIRSGRKKSTSSRNDDSLSDINSTPIKKTAALRVPRRRFESDEAGQMPPSPDTPSGRRKTPRFQRNQTSPMPGGRATRSKSVELNPVYRKPRPGRRRFHDNDEEKETKNDLMDASNKTDRTQRTTNRSSGHEEDTPVTRKPFRPPPRNLSADAKMEDINHKAPLSPGQGARPKRNSSPTAPTGRSALSSSDRSAAEPIRPSFRKPYSRRRIRQTDLDDDDSFQEQSSPRQSRGNGKDALDATKVDKVAESLVDAALETTVCESSQATKELPDAKAGEPKVEAKADDGAKAQHDENAGQNDNGTLTHADPEPTKMDPAIQTLSTDANETASADFRQERETTPIRNDALASRPRRYVESHDSVESGNAEQKPQLEDQTILTTAGLMGETSEKPQDLDKLESVPATPQSPKNEDEPFRRKRFVPTKRIIPRASSDVEDEDSKSPQKRGPVDGQERSRIASTSVREQDTDGGAFSLMDEARKDASEAKGGLNSSLVSPTMQMPNRLGSVSDISTNSDNDEDLSEEVDDTSEEDALSLTSESAATAMEQLNTDRDLNASNASLSPTVEKPEHDAGMEPGSAKTQQQNNTEFKRDFSSPFGGRNVGMGKKSSSFAMRAPRRRVSSSSSESGNESIKDNLQGNKEVNKDDFQSPGGMQAPRRRRSLGESDREPAAQVNESVIHAEASDNRTPVPPKPNVDVDSQVNCAQFPNKNSHGGTAGSMRSPRRQASFSDSSESNRSTEVQKRQSSASALNEGGMKAPRRRESFSGASEDRVDNLKQQNSSENEKNASRGSHCAGRRNLPLEEGDQVETGTRGRRAFVPRKFDREASKRGLKSPQSENDDDVEEKPRRSFTPKRFDREASKRGLEAQRRVRADSDEMVDDAFGKEKKQEEDSTSRRSFTPRKFDREASKKGLGAPRRARADSDASDEDEKPRRRAWTPPKRQISKEISGSRNQTAGRSLPSQSLQGTNEDAKGTSLTNRWGSSMQPSQPQRRVAPERTSSKSLRVTPERATSFQRQAPGRRSVPADDDPGSVTVLQRGVETQRGVPGRAVSMSAVGLSSLRVQRMESNTGLKQMASAVQRDGPQRNAPGRAISSKALRVTPERTTSLRRQLPGRTPVANEGFGEVTVLERGNSGGRSAPLRAASMNLAAMRRTPERSASGLRRHLPEQDLARSREETTNFLGRGAPLRAASMGLGQKRTPMRTASSLRRQRFAEQSVPSISENDGDDDGRTGFSQLELPSPSLSAGLSQPSRRAPQRTASSMRRRVLAEQSVAPISEELVDTSLPRAPVRSQETSCDRIDSSRRAPLRTASSLRRQALATQSVAPISEDGSEHDMESSLPQRPMDRNSERRAPVRTASSLRRQALAEQSVAPISEDGGEHTDSKPSLPRRPMRSTDGMSRGSQSRTPMRTASSLRRQALADQAVAPISEDHDEFEEGGSSLPRQAIRSSRETMDRSSQRRAPMRTASSLRRQALAEQSVATISEEGGEDMDSSAPRRPVRSSGAIERGLQRMAPVRTASSLRRQALAAQSVAPINEDEDECDLSPKAPIRSDDRFGSQLSSADSAGLESGPSRRAPGRTASSIRRQFLAQQSVAPISEEGASSSPPRSTPMRASSMGVQVQRKAPMRTVSSLRRQALAEQSVAPISEEEELTDSPSGQLGRTTPLRASSMSVALLGRSRNTSAPVLPRRGDEPQRSAPGRTISAKALRVTPERTTSLRRQAPGRSQASQEQQIENQETPGEVTVIERAGPGRAAPLRAASMSLAHMGRRTPARTVSGMRRQGNLSDNTEELGRSAPARAASMSVAQMGRRAPPARTVSGMRRQLPTSSDPQRSIPPRTISSKALRVTPERTVSGLRRQAPGRQAQEADADDPGSVMVLQRANDNSHRLAPIRAASMNLAHMRRIATGIGETDSMMKNAEPRRGAPERTISSKALRVTPERTVSLRRQAPGRSSQTDMGRDGSVTVLQRSLPGENAAHNNSGLGYQGDNPDRSVPLRARSMTVAPIASFRVQRQESMSGLRAMAAMASKTTQSSATSDAGNTAKRLPERTVSSKALRVTPERSTSLRRQAPGRRSSATNETNGEITLLHRTDAAPEQPTGVAASGERGAQLPERTASMQLRNFRNRRRSSLEAVGLSLMIAESKATESDDSEENEVAPPRTSSSSSRRQLPERTASGMARQVPARAQSVNETFTTGRQLPQRTSSSRQRMVPARTSSGVGTRQLPQRTGSSRQRLAPIRTPSTGGMSPVRQPPQRNSSSNHLAAPISHPSLNGEESRHVEDDGNTPTDRYEGSDDHESYDGTMSPMNASVRSGTDEDGILQSKSSFGFDGVEFQEKSDDMKGSYEFNSVHTQVSLNMDCLILDVTLDDVLEGSKETMKSSCNITTEPLGASGTSFLDDSRTSRNLGDDGEDDGDCGVSEGSESNVLSSRILDDTASASDLPSLVDSETEEETSQKRQLEDTQHKLEHNPMTKDVQACQVSTLNSALSPETASIAISGNPRPPRRRTSDSSQSETASRNEADAEEEETNNTLSSRQQDENTSGFQRKVSVPNRSGNPCPPRRRSSGSSQSEMISAATKEDAKSASFDLSSSVCGTSASSHSGVNDVPDAIVQESNKAANGALSPPARRTNESSTTDKPDAVMPNTLPPVPRRRTSESTYTENPSATAEEAASTRASPEVIEDFCHSDVMSHADAEEIVVAPSNTFPPSEYSEKSPGSQEAEGSASKPTSPRNASLPQRRISDSCDPSEYSEKVTGSQEAETTTSISISPRNASLPQRRASDWYDPEEVTGSAGQDSFLPAKNCSPPSPSQNSRNDVICDQVSNTSLTAPLTTDLSPRQGRISDSINVQLPKAESTELPARHFSPLKRKTIESSKSGTTESRSEENMNTIVLSIPRKNLGASGSTDKPSVSNNDRSQLASTEPDLQVAAKNVNDQPRIPNESIVSAPSLPMRRSSDVDSAEVKDRNPKDEIITTKGDCDGEAEAAPLRKSTDQSATKAGNNYAGDEKEAKATSVDEDSAAAPKTLDNVSGDQTTTPSLGGPFLSSSALSGKGSTPVSSISNASPPMRRESCFDDEPDKISASDGRNAAGVSAELAPKDDLTSRMEQHSENSVAKEDALPEAFQKNGPESSDGVESLTSQIRQTESAGDNGVSVKDAVERSVTEQNSFNAVASDLTGGDAAIHDGSESVDSDEEQASVSDSESCDDESDSDDESESLAPLDADDDTACPDEDDLHRQMVEEITNRNTSLNSRSVLEDRGGARTAKVGGNARLPKRRESVASVASTIEIQGIGDDLSEDGSDIPPLAYLDAPSIRDDESMPPLEDALSVRDDESMPPLDDVTSVRDDESYFTRDDGLSVKDDDSMPLIDDAMSIKDDYSVKDGEDDSMPPLSDIASASVRDDESMPAFDDETTVKDDERSKSIHDGAQGDGREQQISDAIGIPPIINTCILKKQRIGPISLSKSPGSVAVPHIIDTSILINHEIATPGSKGQMTDAGERKIYADITVVNPYHKDAANLGEALLPGSYHGKGTEGIEAGAVTRSITASGEASSAHAKQKNDSMMFRGDDDIPLLGFSEDQANDNARPTNVASLPATESQEHDTTAESIVEGSNDEGRAVSEMINSNSDSRDENLISTEPSNKPVAMFNRWS